MFRELELGEDRKRMSLCERHGIEMIGRLLLLRKRMILQLVTYRDSELEKEAQSIILLVSLVHDKIDQRYRFFFCEGYRLGESSITKGIGDFE
jgi:hypothetical protein